MTGARRPTKGECRLLALAGLCAVSAAIAVPVALAAPSKPAAIADPSADVSGPVDLTRVALQRAADGRLRATLSFAARVTPRTLLAAAGPPGSACLRISTAVTADATAMRPDRLVCVTARSSTEFRGGVYEVTGAALPKRLADASVKPTASGRSIVLRFTQSALGRPQRIRFAGESTRPGCEAVTCIDTVPDTGKLRAFRLR